MIEYSPTTVFNVQAHTIVNTINCVGVMGGGLALEFRLRYPEMFEEYVAKCERKEVRVGHPYLYIPSASPWILNFPTKNHWKYPSRLSWIEQGLSYFVESVCPAGVESVAFSPLGCDGGGLDWNDVRPLMERYLGMLPIQVYVCLDREREASGIEAAMVAMLNAVTESSLRADMHLRSSIARKIAASLPVRRFRHLEGIPGVGERTYSHLFRQLYQRALTDGSSVAIPKSQLPLL